MMYFLQSFWKSKLELTNELDDKEVITGLDKNIFIEILYYKMEIIQQ